MNFAPSLETRPFAYVEGSGIPCTGHDPPTIIAVVESALNHQKIDQDTAK